MKDTHAIPVRDLISGGDSALSELAATAEEIKVLNRLLQSVLNEPLRSHVQVANVHGDRLVIQCDSPVWGARARLLVPRLLESVNRAHADKPIRRVQVITRPEPPRPESPPPAPARISEQTRKLLENVASEMENPRLRRALFRLAKRKP